jgi:hypothetical protein
MFELTCGRLRRFGFASAPAFGRLEGVCGGAFMAGSVDPAFPGFGVGRGDGWERSRFARWPTSQIEMLGHPTAITRGTSVGVVSRIQVLQVDSPI